MGWGACADAEGNMIHRRMEKQGEGEARGKISKGRRSKGQEKQGADEAKGRRSKGKE